MGLREGLVLLLQLGEQAHVLDGDHGLVGEGLEEGDLLVGEWIHFSAPEVDDPDCRALPKQWHAQDSPMTEPTGVGTTCGKFCRRGLEIRYVNCLPVEECA